MRLTAEQTERALDLHEGLWSEFLTYGEGLDYLGTRYGVPILDDGYTVMRAFTDDESWTVVDSFEEAVGNAAEGLRDAGVHFVEVYDGEGDIQLRIDAAHYARWAL